MPWASRRFWIRRRDDLRSASRFENLGTLRADADGAKVVVRVTPFTNAGVIEELNGGKVLINP